MKDPATATKDPDAHLDYKWDWSKWLPDGDTITDAALIPEGVTVASHSHDTTTVTAWVTGGTLNTTARLTCRITTAHGRTDDRTIRLHVRHR